MSLCMYLCQDAAPAGEEHPELLGLLPRIDHLRLQTASRQPLRFFGAHKLFVFLLATNMPVVSGQEQRCGSLCRVANKGLFQPSDIG